MEKVVFACVHNAGRSQMAAAFFNAIADPSRAHAISAGDGTGTARPSRGDGGDERCGDKFPFVPGARIDDWPLEDPKGKPPERVRAIRDEIRRRVTEMVTANGWLR
jgi:arsenate reductase